MKQKHFTMADSINEQIYQCDGCDLTHKWEDNGGYVCEGTTKYHALQLYYNTGGGWEAATPTITKPGSVIEEKSMDCGYPEPRLRATLADGSIRDVRFTCTQGADTCHLSADEIMNSGIPISQIRNAEFYGGNQIGTSIYGFVFAGCQTLSAVTFHGRYEDISDYCFYSTGVRSISGSVGFSGDFSFAGCKNLTSVTVTNDSSIGGWGVFANCTGLTSIDLSRVQISYTSDEYGYYTGGGSCLFLGCINLRTAKVRVEGRPGIPPSCFERCTNLLNVEINTDDVQPYVPGPGTIGYTIRDRAFFNCTNLSAITETKQTLISEVGKFAFAGCENLPESDFENKFGVPSGETTYSIADGTFMNCKLFTHIPEPQLTVGGEYLHEEVVPFTGDASVTSVGICAFSGCTGLQSVEFDSNITSIGSHAFDGCTGLTGITIDNSTPPTLGEGAFDGSTCSIYVPCNSIIDYVNSSYVWESYKSRISGIPPCSQPVYTVRARATYADGRVVTNYCDGVSTSINNLMFNYPKSGMTNIEFGECVTHVGDFTDCINLTSVNIPSGVTSIGDYAFARCSGLMSFIVNSTTPPQLDGGSGTQTFYGTPITLSTGIIYVPASAVETYKSTVGWSNFSSKIQAIPGS